MLRVASILLAVFYCSLVGAGLISEQRYPQHPGLVFAALYMLPESQAEMVRVLGDRELETQTPYGLATQFSADERGAAQHEINSWLGRLEEAERARFLYRLDTWLAMYSQLQYVGRLVGIETVVSALAAIQQTAPIVRDTLGTMGVNTDTDLSGIGGSLASAQMTYLEIKVLTFLSAMPEEDQLGFWRDFYAQLPKSIQ